MRTALVTALLLGAFAGAARAFPAPPPRPHAGRSPQTPAKQPATHAVRGVVKSVGNTSLVIALSPKKPSDMTFVLNAATLRAGTIAPGVTVSVRYRTEGKTLVATAVTVLEVKHPR